MSSALSGGFFTTSATWKAQWCINVIINLSKPTECKTLKWNPNVNYGLWVIKKKKFIYQNVFSNKNWLGHRLHSILVGAKTWITVILNEMETNRDHSVIFEIASKHCVSDSFVAYKGYSISSKGFLPTGVDIMVIWVKFTHSSPF